MIDRLHKDKTEKIIGLVYQVRNQLGAGWAEEIYHQALLYFLEKNNVPFVSKPRQSFLHANREVHVFEPDIIVWDEIILELKVLPKSKGKNFPKANEAQLLHYLKFNEMAVGLLLNLYHGKVGIQRMIYEPRSYEIEQDYSAMIPVLREAEKSTLRIVQKFILKIAKTYGMGYPESIYRKILCIELGLAGIEFSPELRIPVQLEEKLLGIQKSSMILIDGQFLLNIRALLKVISSGELLKTKSYLGMLGLKVGWIINFGIDQLSIIAVSAAQSK